MTEMKRINVLVEKDLLKRASDYKIKEGRAIGWQMNKGLEMFLTKK